MPDRSSDGSGSKTKGHTITLIHGLYDQGVLIDLYGRLIPAAGQDQTPTSRRSQLKSDMLNFKILGVLRWKRINQALTLALSPRMTPRELGKVIRGERGQGAGHGLFRLQNSTRAP